jgi:hypothetical protein
VGRLKFHTACDWSIWSTTTSFSGPEQSSSPASQLFCIAATVGAAPVFSMKPASERRKRAFSETSASSDDVCGPPGGNW